MSAISELQPQALWQHFDKMCSIPHPSKHEQAMVDWVLSWAEQQGLATQQDQVGNVFIRKPATPGMEDRVPVVLQAHLDMVPQANNDTNHDFTKDPIRPYIDGEWVTAEGTTLGADNGIGAASILAVFGSTDIPHGPLEALLTIDEEAGMTGAFGLKPGYLEGKILINTDSEQEGEVYMGCAGGADTNVRFASQWQAVPQGHQVFELQVTGLKGGHSGCDIHTGRGNANKLSMRILAKALSEGMALQLGHIQGGSLRNAIPREAVLQFSLAEQDQPGFKALLEEQVAAIKAEYGSVETQLEISLKPADAEQVLLAEHSSKIINSLNACLNGVISMSQDIQGVVETSLNVGVISVDEQQVCAKILVRSLIDSGREQVESSLASLFGLVGAEVSHTGAYPGWKPEPESAIKRVVENSYKELYGSTPNTMVIHAGLECGLFKSSYPAMDMVSFGPTIKFPHSPDEKVEIATVERYWQLMLKTLENIPRA